MNQNIDLERAFKDYDYRQSLSSEQLATLPANPAGDDQLSEEELDETAGGFKNNYVAIRPGPHTGVGPGTPVLTIGTSGTSVINPGAVILKGK